MTLVLTGLLLAAGHSVQVRSHKGCHDIPSGTDLWILLDSLGIDVIDLFFDG